MVSSSKLQFSDDEERAQQPRYQRRAFVAQRVGWAVFALIVVAALAGLLGPGPLSWASATAPSGLVEVEYSRFVRDVGDSNVELRVQPDPAQPDTARVWISSEYLSSLNLQQVTPEPDTWTAVDEGVVLAFPTSGPDPVTVQIHMRPDELGLLRGTVGAPGQEPVEFWQFVYP
jgi:hypothetical protein